MVLPHSALTPTLNVPGQAIHHWFPTASHALPPICQHLMRHTTSCNPLCTNHSLWTARLSQPLKAGSKTQPLEVIDQHAQVKSVSQFSAPPPPLYLPFKLRAGWIKRKATDPHWRSSTEIWRRHAGERSNEVSCCYTFTEQLVGFKSPFSFCSNSFVRPSPFMWECIHFNVPSRPSDKTNCSFQPRSKQRLYGFHLFILRQCSCKFLCPVVRTVHVTVTKPLRWVVWTKLKAEFEEAHGPRKGAKWLFFQTSYTATVVIAAAVIPIWRYKLVLPFALELVCLFQSLWLYMFLYS